jgi:hypothetical protein
MSDQEVMDFINQQYRRLTGVTRQARYRYYAAPDKDRFFWTTEKINHKGSPKFVAGIYRYLKSKKAYKLVKEVGFARRGRAKQWALDAYKKATAPVGTIA